MNFLSRFSPLFLLLVGMLLTGCQAVGPNTATGGALGTLTGSLAGAAIGASEGKSPEGALIGAVAGGALGSAAGNAVDRQLEQDRLTLVREQQIRESAAINVGQVVQMLQSGLSPEIVVNQIQRQGVSQPPTIDDLVFLQNNGANNQIIEAYQRAPSAHTPANAANYHSPGPVYYEAVVAEPFFYRRNCYPRPRCRPPGFYFRF